MNHTFLNFRETSLKQFHPEILKPTDAPSIRLKSKVTNLAANLENTKKNDIVKKNGKSNL